MIAQAAGLNLDIVQGYKAFQSLGHTVASLAIQGAKQNICSPATAGDEVDTWPRWVHEMTEAVETRYCFLRGLFTRRLKFYHEDPMLDWAETPQPNGATLADALRCLGQLPQGRSRCI